MHKQQVFSFDDVVCISLRDRRDRRAHVERVLRDINVPFRFHLVERDVRGGRVGCFTSHIDVIRDAYDRGLNSVMIFEDDVVTTPAYNSSVIRDICRYLETDPDWELVQFGYGPECVGHVPFGILKFISSGHVHGCGHLLKWMGSLTHAYAVSRTGMRKILDKASGMLARPADQVRHLDAFYLHYTGLTRCYAATPMQFDQKWCLGNDNIGEGVAENFGRRFVCSAEKVGLYYHLSRAKQYITIDVLMFMLVVGGCILINGMW